MGIELSIETLNLTELGEKLSQVLTPARKADIVTKAMKKVVPVVESRLRTLTPVGPTGNLKAAVNSKVVTYVQSGNAVGVVGYNRAGKARSTSAAGGRVRRGPDRAFHQWWLEDGTNDRIISKLSNTPYARKGHTRRTKSGTTTTVRPHQVSGQNAYIASSFRRLGPYKFVPTERRESGQRVQTDPAYPNAFFKKSSQPIRIDGMSPGGRAGRAPLATAWSETQSTAAEILQRELRIALESALAEFVRGAA